MTTEKEIKEMLLLGYQKAFPKEKALQLAQSLDTQLEILELAEAQGIDAPEAERKIIEAVTEPDEFWTHCVQQTYIDLNRPNYSLKPIENLIKLMAIEYGIKLLRDAYRMESEQCF